MEYGNVISKAIEIGFNRFLGDGPWTNEEWESVNSDIFSDARYISSIYFMHDKRDLNYDNDDEYYLTVRQYYMLEAVMSSPAQDLSDEDREEIYKFMDQNKPKTIVKNNSKVQNQKKQLKNIIDDTNKDVLDTDYLTPEELDSLLKSLNGKIVSENNEEFDKENETYKNTYDEVKYKFNVMNHYNEMEDIRNRAMTTLQPEVDKHNIISLLLKIKSDVEGWYFAKQGNYITITKVEVVKVRKGPTSDNIIVTITAKDVNNVFETYIHSGPYKDSQIINWLHQYCGERIINL